MGVVRDDAVLFAELEGDVVGEEGGSVSGFVGEHV